MTLILAVFAASTAGVVAMLVWKLPALRRLGPHSDVHHADLMPQWLRRVWDRFQWEDVWESGVMVALEKVLRTIRLWALKMDHRASALIERLRQRKQSNGGGSAQGTAKESETPMAVAESAASDEQDEGHDEEISSYLPPEAHRREQELIRNVAEDPRAVTAYKELGFLYHRHNLNDYAREALDMAVRLGSSDKRARRLLERLSGDVAGDDD